MADLSAPSQYDLTTYWGRVRHFMNITDPRTLLVSKSELIRSQKLLDDVKHNTKKDVSPSDYWKAKKIVDSTIHPDTGEPILLPFRMSSFVPTNLIVVAGMLLPNPSTASLLFWQFTNQSVNVAFNYCNANKSTQMSTSETARAYASAVTVSCGLALGLNRLIPRLKNLSPGVKGALSRLIPFTAVAAAGTVNVFLMRGKELTEGIAVTDEQGNVVGKSPKAGLSAVSQVAISRVLTNAPTLIIPPLVLASLQKTSIFRAYPGLTMPANLVLIAANLLISLPFAIATFPQHAKVPVRDLEEKFWNLRDAKGKKIEYIFYNKGL